MPSNSALSDPSPVRLQKFPSRLNQFWRDYGWAYLFILIPVLLFLVFTLYPVVTAFLMSFQKYKILGSDWVGLANYKYMFQDEVFWKSIRNTVIFTIGTVPVNIAIPFMLTFFIFQLRNRWQTFFKTVLYLPAVASGVTISLVWLAFFDPTPSGMLNQFLGLLGIDPVIWLGQSNTALFSLMLMTYLGAHGSGIILYLAAMGGIPKSLYEAADIDHASRWAKFTKITWPLLKPTTLYLLVMGVITSFQVFISVYLMTQGGPNFATATTAYLIYETAFVFNDFGLASAQSFVLAAMIIVTSVLQFKYFSTDIEY
ncbi:L-arabinose transport system permease protein AraP [Paenibacillus larvae subsp. larvae]|uniref:L-arabinose transport system permease protein AraP n=1 Tax=Paenibacillus larvae subsp. larvae TaxID=147375 RepID=A0A2L1TVA9_9BACL|nr:sugar ABC transporter permease [Paenibacillus larvae]AQT85308.1 spermidine/putrescine ABC transporter permease [Paenibacillus larvae subsp. pulvifaciens]AQZ47314.1 spermidine/putrescine ABC transporter permease [Paenibacillus larvae subsp. pulvifaciens]AVF24619.1 L-arabinose transport system permease protein AraP [Paenibacillus larvae subsp. larvae]AVF29380.1 L-arabinose transport system permease protein AraP [Paenibacillus larvae subsp. larvae]MBH0343175.1 spermidine/putrescine ABC transpo